MWRVAFDEVEGLVRWARWEDGPWQLHAARVWDEHGEQIDLRILFKESLGSCIKEDEDVQGSMVGRGWHALGTHPL